MSEQQPDLILHGVAKVVELLDRREQRRVRRHRDKVGYSPPASSVISILVLACLVVGYVQLKELAGRD